VVAETATTASRASGFDGLGDEAAEVALVVAVSHEHAGFVHVLDVQCGPAVAAGVQQVGERIARVAFER
jgi:hypothetical protein